MLIPDILVPTCKTEEELMPMLATLSFFSDECSVIYTCKNQSAAKNRNEALDQATSDFIIMIDDDIEGFYTGWWKELVMPLIRFSDISLVSARLMNRHGAIGAMMHGNKDIITDIVPVEYTPSACIAFRRDSLRFDESYVGSGFEDTDFCEQLKVRYPGSRFVINNKCRMVHLNEQKNQHGKNFQLNKQYYQEKWNKTWSD
jgi:glycosyltransferase involved in cell wall biosynthesis